MNEPTPRRRPDAINYVRRYLIDPCDAPLTAYVQTFLQALLIALIQWYWIDFAQIVSGWVKPARAGSLKRSLRKGHRGHKSGRINKGRLLWHWLKTDWWDELGKRLPGSAAFTEVNYSRGATWVWTFHGLIERVQFYVFVAEVVNDFFVNWTSLMWQTRYCQASRASLFNFTGGGYFISNIVPFNGFVATTAIKQRGVNVWSGTSAVFGSRFGTMAASAHVIPASPGPANYSVLIIKGSTPTGEVIARADYQAEEDQPMDLRVDADCNGTGTFSVWITTDLLFAVVVETWVYGQAVGK